MNAILKGILKVGESLAEEVAANTIPGSSLVIRGVRKLLDKDHTNNAEAVSNLEEGLIQALEALKPDAVKDPLLLTDGINEARLAFTKIQLAIK